MERGHHFIVLNVFIYGAAQQILKTMTESCDKSFKNVWMAENNYRFAEK
jgi:hypothetical protein